MINYLLSYLTLLDFMSLKGFLSNFLRYSLILKFEKDLFVSNRKLRASIFRSHLLLCIHICIQKS